MVIYRSEHIDLYPESHRVHGEKNKLAEGESLVSVGGEKKRGEGQFVNEFGQSKDLTLSHILS